MDNPLVRTADSIFTDRINLWQRLREIEDNTEGLQEIEAQTIEEFITKTIRLELCFSELKAFNDTGKFIGKHPFISERDERSRISELLRAAPDKYFEERKNVELNITRYSSQINGKKSSPEAKKRAAENLEKFKVLLQMYKEVFQEYVKR